MGRKKERERETENEREELEVLIRFLSTSLLTSGGLTMFILFNVVGWALNELGLADEFVRLVEFLVNFVG